MHLNPMGHLLGVLLFHAITTITTPAAGRAEPTGSSPVPPEPAVTPLLPDPRGPLQLDSMPGLPDSSSSSSSQQESDSSPEWRPKRDRTFYKPRKSAGEWVDPPHGPPHGNCSRGRIKHLVQGKFYVTGQLQANIQSLGFQADSAASVQPHRGRPRIRGQRVGGPEESWQKLQPVVECGDDSMTLTVRKRRAVQLLLDRANESSVPLVQLVPHCGYSVQTTWRDLSLKTRYDACHVTQEDNSFVLPLLWRGTPVRMSCPVSVMALQPGGPSSLCCSPFGMTVRVPDPSAPDEHRVNVRGEWTPLMLLAERCGYTLDRSGDQMVIAAPFLTCGITMKDEKYTLTLETGNEIFSLACPASPLEQFPVTHQPLLTSRPHVHDMPTTPVLGSLEPFPWAPPFYLAPPYYPHPTNHRTSSQSEAQDTLNSPAPPTLPPESSFGPHSHSDPYSHQRYPQETPPQEHFSIHTSQLAVDEMDSSGRSYQERNEQEHENQETLVVDGQHSSAPTGFPAQVEAPHVQPPRHEYSPYYHYYHHPKIPLPGTPIQDPDPGPQVPKEPPATHQFPVLPTVQEPEDFDSGQFLPHEHKPSPEPFTVLTNSPIPHKEALPGASPPPQPYPYYYFPHVVGEAKRLALSHPGKATKTNMDENYSVLGSPVPPVHEYTTQAHIPDDDDEDDEFEDSVTHSPFFTNYVKPVTEDVLKDPTPPGAAMESPIPERFHEADSTSVPPPEQSSPHPAVNYDTNPYQYYYHHPYSDYYVMYYGPEGLFNVFNSMPEIPQKPSTPQTQESPFLTPPLPTSSPYDFQSGEESPYFYYYHHYSQPRMLKDNQELHPPDPKESAKAAPQPGPVPPGGFEYGSIEWLVEESGQPSVALPRFNSFFNLHPQDGSWQQHNLVDQPAAREERLANEMPDHSKTGTHTPFASPCGFDAVSDPECGNSLDCCTHAVRDCTVGQYFIFVVPDSVLEPTVVPTAQSSDSGESCTLQRLTSDLDIYIVPLDGCGVNKHIFGDTVLHLLEVQGIHSYQDGKSAHDILPVRLTVGCSSSPDSPGEVMFHVMDQLSPPPPTPAAIFVRLRIATDESFSSYHPEAHLPLSAIRGRPVHVELSLLDPAKPGLVLMVHSCLAYTQEPYASWMLVYDGCQNQEASQLLPPRNSHHIQRITISSFLPLPPETPLHAPRAGGYSFMEDPQIYFMCLTEVCNTVGSDCALICFKSPQSHMRAIK